MLLPHKTPIRRREFTALGSALLGGVFPHFAHAESNSPNERLNIGIIGTGGRGIDNLAGVKGENIAALCDVDEQFLGESATRFPKANQFRDFRKLLESDNLDAVIIATPDHTHALAAITAMRRGLHVYCEKPLAHNLRETELMASVAAQTKVATQMGNAFHAAAGFRRVVQILESGALGKIREVHAWTSRPVWPQGIDRPRESQSVPKSLAWDLWLGPAPQRPYDPAYHPRDWRGWWDFGTGALGDFVPHLLDPIFEGLQLDIPDRIAARTSAVNAETAPRWSLVDFQFPARDKQPEITIHWYDGGKQPPEESTGVKRLPGNGALVIGERGRLFVPTHGKQPIVLPVDEGDRPELPPPLPPPKQTHWQEWITACKSGKPTGSSFGYAAKLTDIALLGNVAIRAGAAIEWDAKARRVTNVAKANNYLARDDRKGWEID